MYTPDALADFVASLLRDEALSDGCPTFGNCLDPACGGFSLLKAIDRSDFPHETLTGIDFDDDAVGLSKAVCNELKGVVLKKDFLCPAKAGNSAEFWKKKLPPINTMIANPPWSSDRIYDQDDLRRHGFHLADGQYDSYTLFIELGLAVLQEGGYAAFIIPDSLFSSTAIGLRKLLATKYEIRVIARLGEKLFEGVHRATTVLVVKNAKPRHESTTKCFRLNTLDRKHVLAGDKLLYEVFTCQLHEEQQLRFTLQADCIFDVDSSFEDHEILAKMDALADGWATKLTFHRGVEISKSGAVYYCPKCGCANGVTLLKAPAEKRCFSCGFVGTIQPNDIDFLVREAPADGFEVVLVGESVGRYLISRQRYLKTGVPGVNYKKRDEYLKPKLLVRKTGLGIKSAVDSSMRLVTQTVYFFTENEGCSASGDALYFYNALLNSRTLFFFYMKRYGENEWKSHPYLTKAILLAMPLFAYDSGNQAHRKVAEYGRMLNSTQDLKTDKLLEKEIQKLYQLEQHEVERISSELAALPDLGALKEMKQ